MSDSEEEDTDADNNDEDSYETTLDCEVMSLKSEEDFNIDQEESFLQYFVEKRDEGLFISYERGRKNQMYFLTTKEKKRKLKYGLIDFSIISL